MAERTPVRIYPLRNGTLVAFDGRIEYDAILTAFAQLMDQAPDSFVGSSLIIDIGYRTLNTDQLLDLETLVRTSLGSRVLQIVSGEAQEIIAEEGGGNRSGAGWPGAARRSESLAGPSGAVGPASSTDAIGTMSPAALRASVEARSDAVVTDPNNAYVLRRTVRSGQRITCEGSIVILGDVNPGAEVIATGNVIVLGHLRGLAHAGARCDYELARIIALQFEPTQLRIGNLVGRPPEHLGAGALYPEVAYVADGHIVVEPMLARHRTEAVGDGS